MITTDAEGRIVRWSPEAQSLLGFKAAQAVGHRFFDLVTARDVFGNRMCSKACGLLAMVRLGESPLTFEMEVETAAGGRMRVFVAAATRGLRVGERLIYRLRADLRRETDRRRTSDRRESRAQPAAPAGAGAASTLSPRELDVLRCLAAGADTQDIAAQLGISATTASNHAQHVLRKLGVHSRLEAIAFAYRHALLEKPSRR